LRSVAAAFKSASPKRLGGGGIGSGGIGGGAS